MAQVVARCLHLTQGFLVPIKERHVEPLFSTHAPRSPLAVGLSKSPLSVVFDCGDCFWASCCSSCDAEGSKEPGLITALYRGFLPPIHVVGSTVLLVDEVLCNSSSFTSALVRLLSVGVKEVVMVGLVGTPQAVEDIERAVKDVVCLCVRLHCDEVWRIYQNIPGAASDAEVVKCIREERERRTQDNDVAAVV
jgi:hypothetical protein